MSISLIPFYCDGNTGFAGGASRQFSLSAWSEASCQYKAKRRIKTRGRRDESVYRRRASGAKGK